LALCCFLWLFAVQIVSAEQSDPAPPPLLLANVLRDSTDVTQYWVSEKLDGVRAIWNGRELRFRSGRLIAAPAWFTANFPARRLDGELWLGRGEFDRLSGIVRKEPPDDTEWRSVRYMLFELPDAPGTFSQRIEQMRAIVAKADIPWLRVIEQTRVRDRAELRRRLEKVLEQRGEGLMLHRADALYTTGRGDDLLKLKPWLDAEATVIEHLPGKGKYLGMLGSLRLEMPNGKRFNLGTGFSDALRRDPPPLGALVTYRYRELNPNGLPRFASFLRIRDEAH
jgi:DNA ligase-1